MEVPEGTLADENERLLGDWTLERQAADEQREMASERDPSSDTVRSRCNCVR